jgi:hypothetical protein
MSKNTSQNKPDSNGDSFDQLRSRLNEILFTSDGSLDGPVEWILDTVPKAPETET